MFDRSPDQSRNAGSGCDPFALHDLGSRPGEPLRSDPGFSESLLRLTVDDAVKAETDDQETEGIQQNGNERFSHALRIFTVEGGKRNYINLQKMPHEIKHLAFPLSNCHAFRVDDRSPEYVNLRRQNRVIL